MSGVVQSRVTAGLLLVLLALIGAWLALGSSRWQGAWARNRGFLAFSAARTTEGSDPLATAQHAAALLEQAVQQDPEPASPWRALGYARLAAGDAEAAIAAWQHWPNMVAELIAVGDQARSAGRTDEAVEWYRRATAVAPEDPTGWLALGQAHEDQGDWLAAEQTYSAGIAAQTTASLANSDLYFRLAQVYANRPQPADDATVLAAADRAIRLDRFVHDWSRLQSHYLRGLALERLGRKQEAMADFRLAADRSPDPYWPLVHLGRLSWELEGDAAAAERYLSAALSANDSDKWAYLALAEVYWNTDRRAEAAELYRIVLRLDERDPTAVSRLGEQ